MIGRSDLVLRLGAGTALAAAVVLTGPAVASADTLAASRLLGGLLGDDGSDDGSDEAPGSGVAGLLPAVDAAVQVDGPLRVDVDVDVDLGGDGVGLDASTEVGGTDLDADLGGLDLEVRVDTGDGPGARLEVGTGALDVVVDTDLPTAADPLTPRPGDTGAPTGPGASSDSPAVPASGPAASTVAESAARTRPTDDAPADRAPTERPADDAPAPTSPSTPSLTRPGTAPGPNGPLDGGPGPTPATPAQSGAAGGVDAPATTTGSPFLPGPGGSRAPPPAGETVADLLNPCPPRTPD